LTRRLYHEYSRIGYHSINDIIFKTSCDRPGMLTTFPLGTLVNPYRTKITPQKLIMSNGDNINKVMMVYKTAWYLTKRSSFSKNTK